ncbi:13716_t:CDS:2 [Acaulospora morrowiae]|uniref:13716_t:CDS:1 n=1 Tax=Acaulospora morrowiae TaxID=94023 RepID=A0A9N9HNR8_9GLOM|nr:13716_t:CDS:2 [Acaulospora morrowiae]
MQKQKKRKTSATPGKRRSVTKNVSIPTSIPAVDTSLIGIPSFLTLSSPVQDQITTASFKQPPMILTFPPEVFINICKFLRPRDLVSLSAVCKVFAQYLISSSSTTTQQIWKEARTLHLRFLQMDPPEGMDERQYIKLSVERGCQFCGKPRIRKIYWAFRTRMCSDCFSAKTESEITIVKDMKLPQDVLLGLPSVQMHFYLSNSTVNYYWFSQVEAMHQQYKSIPQSQLPQWKTEMETRCTRLMQDVRQREVAEAKERLARSHDIAEIANQRKQYLRERIEEMAQEKNDEGNLRYVRSYIMSTDAFINASVAQRPMTNRAWKMLKRKIIQEHDARVEENSVSNSVKSY